MRIKKFATATALAIAAIGLIENTAFAAPPPISTDVVSDIPERAEGVDRGVSYIVQRDEHTLAADITGGTFRVSEDAIEVVGEDGTSIASIPRALPIGEHVVTLAPRVEANGTKLVADVSAQEIGYWRKTSPKQRSIEAGIGIGGLIGGLAGAVVGIVIGIAGMGLLLPISLPIGLIVGVLGGMAIGGAAGAAVPNSDVPDQWEYQEECEYHGDYRFCW